MCARLAAHGHRVTAYDVREEALADAVERGATAAASAAAAVGECDFAVLCVGDERDVEDVVLGGAGIADALAPGSALIETTSSKPSVTRRIGEALASRGVDMLDAPTSRGVPAAEAGTMSVMVGGDEAVLERCRPIIETFGSDIFHVGPLGAGHAVKALNMLALGTALVATAEAVAMAERAGVAPERVIDILNVSSGGSFASEFHYPRFVLNGSFDSGFTLGLMEKDLRIAVETAHEAGMPVPMGERVLTLYRLLLGRTGPETDNTHVTRYLELLTEGDRDA